MAAGAEKTLASDDEQERSRDRSFSKKERSRARRSEGPWRAPHETRQRPDDF
jgi:hypothetical protein